MSSLTRTSDSPVRPGPSRFSQLVSTVFVLIAVTFLRSPVGIAITVAVLGAILFILGIARGNQRNVHRGFLIQLGAIVISGIEGLSSGSLVAGTVAVFAAWDVASYGVLLGEQLGRKPDTMRMELVRAAHSTGLGVAGAVLVFAVYHASVDTGSIAAITLLLVGGFALTLALR